MAANTIIAIVDDDDLVRASLASLLRSFDVGAEAFPSAEDFLAADPDRFDCVVSDFQMPGMSGLDLTRMLNARDVPVPVIVITAFPERALDASRLGGSAQLLEKPVDSAQLISCIEKVIGRPIG